MRLFGEQLEPKEPARIRELQPKPVKLTTVSMVTSVQEHVRIVANCRVRGCTLDFNDDPVMMITFITHQDGMTKETVRFKVSAYAQRTGNPMSALIDQIRELHIFYNERRHTDQLNDVIDDWFSSFVPDEVRAQSDSSTPDPEERERVLIRVEQPLPRSWPGASLKPTAAAVQDFWESLRPHSH